MPKPLRALLIEDSEDDALLLITALQRGGYELQFERVQTADDLRQALSQKHWDIVLCDHSMPAFDAPAALRILQASGLNLPAIIISGTIGEEVAVESLKQGADDYLLKQNLSRLVPAIERSLANAENRRQRCAAEMALIQSEAALKQAQAIAHVGNWSMEISTGTFVASKEAARLMGWASTVFSQKEVVSTIHPEDFPKVKAAWESALAGRAPYDIEHRVLVQGQYKWLHARAQIEFDKAGQPFQAHGTSQDITERKQNERQLRALSTRVEQLREAERTRIAQEIHDELGQMLTGIKMDLRWLEGKISSLPSCSQDGLLDRIVSASALVDETITSVQRIASDLRPSVLDKLGLTTALQYEAKRFAARTGIFCEIFLPDGVAVPRTEVATALFRIFQEALTNVARHAQASHVFATLRVSAQTLCLEISDNGRGIPETILREGGSLGILGMKERAASLGGSVVLTRSSHGGTAVLVQVPLMVPGEACGGGSANPPG